MSFTVVLVFAILFLLWLASRPKQPAAQASGISDPLSQVFRAPVQRSLRDIEIEEDLAAVADAYRESESLRRKQEALAKIAAIAAQPVNAKKS